jgi:hypothetical protein
MVNPIRRSFLVFRSRVVRAACLASGLAIALLMSTTASAALREYRVNFEQSPSPSATGYTLHIGPDTGNYTLEFDLGSPPAQGGTVIYAVDLEDSIDLFVALRAYDSSGVQSALSNELVVQAILPPPSGGDTGGGTSDGDSGTDTGTGGTDTGTGGSDGGSTTGDTGDSGSGGVVSSLDAAYRLGLTTTTDGLINTVLGDGSLEFLTMDSLAARGDLRPVRCDLDGDGDRDLVIGFGTGGGGQVALIFLENDAVTSVSTIVAGPESYRAVLGRTNPACGDLDGDGRAEIVIGFAWTMRGVVQVFDDVQSGFSPLASARSNAEGYMQIPVPDDFWGPTYPAIGNIDGDATDELVVGMGRTVGGGRLVVLDDLSTGFAIHSGNRTGEPWLRVDADPQRLQSLTRTMPALGDIDGDGRDEIAVSFGMGGLGRIALLQDAIDGFPMTSSDVLLMTAGRPRYQSKDGATRSAFDDVDADGIDELIVGFRRGGRYELQIFDDMRVGMRPMIANGGFISAADRSIVIIPTPVN